MQCGADEEAAVPAGTQPVLGAGGAVDDVLGNINQTQEVVVVPEEEARLVPRAGGAAGKMPDYGAHITVTGPEDWLEHAGHSGLRGRRRAARLHLGAPRQDHG